VALRAEVDKLRSKIISQRDACDERVAKLVAETRDTNQRSIHERQTFQNDRLRLQQQIDAAKKNAELHSDRADVRIGSSTLASARGFGVMILTTYV
jgi:hypothetical protein